MPILELRRTDGIQLKKAFPDVNHGIFNFFGENPPWKSICDNTVMNNTLFFSYGERIASPVLSHFMWNDKTPAIDSDTLHTVDDSDANVMAQMLIASYGEKWKRLLAINESQYNPLHNYDMTEKETGSATGLTQETGNATHSNALSRTATGETGQSYSDARLNSSTTSGTDTNTANNSLSGTQTQTSEGDSGIYAFNSENAVPVNENSAKDVKSTTNSGKSAVSSSSDTKSISSDSTSGKRAETEKRLESESANTTDNESKSGSRSETNMRTLERSGNIGVTSSVQLLTQERDFWSWSYIRVIVEDVADFLTIGVY